MVRLLAFLLAAGGRVLAQNSFWSDSVVPDVASISDTRELTLGLSFTSDVPGSVAGVRFYKGPTNTGVHTGTLWSGSGIQLASVTFDQETSSGWQQANFSSPVPISANTPYVISYFAPQGSCAFNGNYAWATVNASPLRLFFGPMPGRYNYGPENTFPQTTFYNGNYWVDVVFTPSPAPPATFSISGNASLPLTTLTLSGSASGVTTTDGNGNYVFSAVTAGSYVVAPGQAGYAFRPPLIPVLVSDASVSGINFMAVRIPRVSLNWAPSVSPNIKGYFVYRGTTPGGPYLRLNASPVPGTTYDDSNVELDQVYFYVTTALGMYDLESAFSNEASARIAIDTRACCN